MGSEVKSYDFKAILFDMDGTLIDSTLAVEGAWATFAKTYTHFDIHEILKTSHGVRTEDNLRRFAPDLTEEQLEAEAQRFEEEIVLSAEKTAAEGKDAFVALPGVANQVVPLLKQPTGGKWAICTSATRAYASKALPLVGIPIPEAFVTADDVSKGKPSPDPYLKGAELTGVEPSDCLVIEDAPAGVRSGKAAGSKVLALLTTHSRKSLEESEADFIAKDLSAVTLQRLNDGWRLVIPNA